MKMSLSRLMLAASFCLIFPQLAAGIGEDSATGVAGNYNGAVTTAGSIDPYTGNARRVVDDILVPNSLGAYPLKWSRIHNTRSSAFGGFGLGGSWSHSYKWGMWVRRPLPPCCYYPNPYEGPDGVVSFPDGREMALREDGGYLQAEDQGEPFGRLEEVEGGNFNFILSDGGRVEFRHPAGSNSGYDLVAKAIVDPYGQRTTFEYNSEGRLSKIIEPGGRYLLITYHTFQYYLEWPVPGWQQAVVIEKVEAFDRPGGTVTQWVTYDYQGVIIGEMFPVHYWHLVGANYSDNTHATYTYQTSNLHDHYPATYRNVLSTCDDPRFAGPMKKIRYEYQSPPGSWSNGSVSWGQVKAEKTFDGQTTVSEVIYPTSVTPQNQPRYRTEKRPDGSTRTFQYSAGAGPELESYTDFAAPADPHHPSYIGYTPGDAYADYYKVFTDARGNPTKVGKESVAGAVVFLKRGNGQPATYHYTDSARPYYLAWKTDERENTTRYTRYSANNLHYPNAIQYINYPDGGFEGFIYNNLGQVTWHLRTSGGIEEFTYDDRGLKLTYKPPWTESDPARHQTVYTYYGNEGGRPDRIDRLKTVTDGRGYTTTYDYNLRGQVTRVTHHDTKYTESEYNPDGTLLWSTDELRHETRYLYDEYKRVIKVTNHLGKYTQNDYTPLNGGLSPLSHTTSSVYRVTSMMGKVTESDYDRNFRRSRTTVGAGTSEAATTTFTHDLAGNLETVTDPNGQATGAHATYVNDDRNRQTSVTDPLGHETITAYDDANNKTNVLRADTHSVQFPIYDEMNRLKKQIDERQFPSYMEYDSAGNLESRKDENGKIYLYDYDALNRKTSMTYPDGTHEDYLYDWAGNLKTYRNRNNAVQTFTYDERNRPTRFTWSDGTSWQETDYDEASRVKEIRNDISTIKYTYYDDNRLHTEEVWTTLDSHIHRTVTYVYDDDGNRQSVQYPGGRSFTYDYTNRGRPWKINTGGQAVVTYGYDPSGNITSIGRNNGTSTALTPDAGNRTTSIVHNLTTGGQKSFGYAYNSVNNLTAVQRDGAQGDGFDYDESRQITGFKQDGDVNLQAGTVINPDNDMRLGFDGCGNRTYASNSDPSRTSYTYAVNNLNQYISMTEGAVTPSPTPPVTPPPTPPPGQTPTPPPGQTPTPPPGQSPSPTPTPPDPTPSPPPPPPGQVGQVLLVDEGYPEVVDVTMTTATAGATIFYRISPIQFFTPTHDGNGHGTNGTAVYTGSPVHVAVNQVRYIRAMAYKTGMIDSAMSDVMVDNTTGGGEAPTTLGGGPTYDLNGNLTGYKGWTYLYDAQNRLKQASKGSHLALFYYDGKNRQIMRTIDGTTRVSVWDDWERIQEYAPGNVRTAEYLQGAHGVIKAWMNSNTEIYYYQDSHGSTTHIANASGQLLESYRYDLYGKPTFVAAGDAPSQPQSAYGITDLWTGERWMGELGLYDLRNRVMSPEIGRFLQPDPIGFKGDASNLYRYCGNDPIDRVDPMGLEWAVIDSETQSWSLRASAQDRAAQQAEGWSARRIFINMTRKSEFGTTVYKDNGSVGMSGSYTDRDWQTLRARDYPGKTSLVYNHIHPHDGTSTVTKSHLSVPDVRVANNKGVTVQVTTPSGEVDRARPSTAATRDGRWSEGSKIERLNPRTGDFEPLKGANADVPRYGPIGESMAAGDSAQGVDTGMRQLNQTISLIVGNNSGEGFHPRGPR